MVSPVTPEFSMSDQARVHIRQGWTLMGRTFACQFPLASDRHCAGQVESKGKMPRKWGVRRRRAVQMLLGPFKRYEDNSFGFRNRAVGADKYAQIRSEMRGSTPSPHNRGCGLENRRMCIELRPRVLVPIYIGLTALLGGRPVEKFIMLPVSTGRHSGCCPWRNPICLLQVVTGAALV